MEESSPECRLFFSLRDLEELRAKHRVFDGAADVWLVQTGDDSVLGIGRYFEGEKLVALYNFSEAEKTVTVVSHEGGLLFEATVQYRTIYETQP